VGAALAAISTFNKENQMSRTSREKIVHATEDAMDDIAAGVREARRRAQRAGSEAADNLGRSARTTLHASEDYSDAATDYVHRHPLIAASVAAAVTALVTSLLFRRR
jgi:ElaB/YqjD/DUF883 family membrane-anchored ribosome-binding protein